MSTKYRIYFNYDNDKKVYCLPVNPEKIEITHKGETTSATIDKFGEVLHKGKRDAADISFSSFFPAKYDKRLCACSRKQFKKPNAWHKWLKTLEAKDKPCHFVVTGSPLKINLYADITSYKAYEAGGDPGTIQYTVELSEHRTPKIGKWKKKVVTKSSKNKARTSNKEKPKTYKVKKGDCLWNIAKKYYGKGSEYKKIYNANKDKIKNPNLIYPGQVLKIP